MTDVADGTEVGPSPIAGMGLFATVPLPSGAVLLRFDAPPHTPADFSPVNHSCEPNLGWVDERTLVALRDIDRGAELTTDYALALDTGGALVWCHCGTYRCRQVVEGDDWRIPQLQQRYAGAWAPHVAERIEALTGSS
jgi:hypothetical protein